MDPRINVTTKTVSSESEMNKEMESFMNRTENQKYTTMELVQMRDATLDLKLAYALDELIWYRKDSFHNPKFNHE